MQSRPVRGRVSRNQQWVVVDSMGQTIYHACGWESEYINVALKSAVTALITHGIINPALCSLYFHINIYTFLHNKSTVCMHDAFFSVIYDYS